MLQTIYRTRRHMGGSQYPCLGMSKDRKLLVLFYQKNCGIVIENYKRDRQKKGFFSKSWIMGGFIPFTGTITLISKKKIIRKNPGCIQKIVMEQIPGRILTIQEDKKCEKKLTVDYFLKLTKTEIFKKYYRIITGSCSCQ